jgi:hypothetical protein
MAHGAVVGVKSNFWLVARQRNLQPLWLAETAPQRFELRLTRADHTCNISDIALLRMRKARRRKERYDWQ